MAESARTDGAEVTDRRDPEQLREKVEETRMEVGETVAALAEKADVKAQAKRKAEEATASLAEKKDELIGRAREASPDGAASASSRVSAKARENPTSFAAAGAFAAGVLVGLVAKRKR